MSSVSSNVSVREINSEINSQINSQINSENLSPGKPPNDQNLDIINDIESGLLTSHEIMSKYELTKYKYYKILKEFGIKNPSMKTGPKGPNGVESNFKVLMSVSNKDLPHDFNQEEFCNDITSKLKISDIVKNHNITLTQFRELRKKYNLK